MTTCKTHGFLYTGNNRWQLSPAFDINPRNRYATVLIKTGISELSGNEASIEAAIEAAPYFDVDQDSAAQLLNGMINMIDGSWRSLFRDAGMTDSAIDYYGPAFNHSETRIARRITGTTVTTSNPEQPEQDRTELQHNP